jgi:hypothetical protein
LKEVFKNTTNKERHKIMDINDEERLKDAVSEAEFQQSIALGDLEDSEAILKHARDELNKWMDIYG